MKRVTLFLTSLALLLSPTNLIGGQERSDDSMAAKPSAAPASDVSKSPARTLPFRAQLLLIKSDWSQGDNAKEIEADWREALKDLPLSQELLDKLPASGPEILFAPDLVKFYRIEHFQQLYRWLTQRGLVEEWVLVPDPEPVLPPALRNKTRGKEVGVPVDEYAATVSKRMDFIPLPPPLRRPGTASGSGRIYWDIVLSKESGRLAIVRKPVVIERKTEQGTASSAYDCLCSVARYALPKGYAALTHAFPASAEGELREAARRAGIEPLIVVFELSPREYSRGSGKKLPPRESRFCLPDSVETVSVQHGHEANLLGPRMYPGRVPPGLTRDPNPPSSATFSERMPGTKKYRVFRLKNADADSVATTLTQLFREDITIDVGGRNKWLLVRGEEPHITEAAKLIERIDVREDTGADGGRVPASKTEDAVDRGLQWLRAPDAYRAGLPASPAMIEGLREGHQSAERAASETAAEIRRMQAASDGRNARTGPAALRLQLRGQVADSFTVRQQLHKAELANLQWKLEQARETISQRNRIKDQIIDRRVQDLLDPELRWDIGQKSTVPSTTQFERQPPRRLEPPSGSRPNQERISFLRELAGENALVQPLLLYFRADWCSPCRKLDPEIQRLREEGAAIMDIDLERQRKTASAFQVDKIPTLVLCVGGTEVDRATGTAIGSLVEKYHGELSKSPPAAAAAELERLQGVWRVTRAVSPTLSREELLKSQVWIEDNNFNVRNVDGDLLLAPMTLRLDPSRTPKQFDLFEYREDRHESIGIYAIEQGPDAKPKRRLRLAFGDKRPTSFADDDMDFYWELERTDEQAEQSISKLEGDWQLESIVGKAIIRHLQEVKARVRGEVWIDVREGHEARRRMVLDATADPKTIDLIDERERMRPPVIPPPPMVYRGIYDVRDDALIIGWGRDASVRPTGFKSEECAIHTWKRIRAPELVPAAEEDSAAAIEGTAPVAADANEESAAPTVDSSASIQHPRAITVRNLARLMLAMHEYCDVHKHFPPAAVLGKDGEGKVPHSWRVELLPFLGHQELYDQYDFDEPWDSEHNKTLLAKMPDVFRSPLDEPDSTSSSYFGVVAAGKKPLPLEEARAGSGPVGPIFNGLSVPREICFLWPTHGVRLGDILDGTKHTIALVEAKRDIPWTKPEDITYHAKRPLPEFGGWFGSGFFAGFGDGMVKFILADNDERTIRNLLTVNDGRRFEPKVIGTIPRDDPLEFRILPNHVETGREPYLSDDEFERSRKQLAKGDLARPAHGDGYCWREIESSIRDIPFTLKQDDRSYVLTSFLDNTLLWSELQGHFRVAGSKMELPEGTSSLDIEFDDEVGAKLRRLTRANLNNRLAIVVCGRVIMAPTIRDEIGSSVKITGVFSKDELTGVLKSLQEAAETDDEDDVPVRSKPEPDPDALEQSRD